MALNIIAAIGRNREIGKNGELSWKLKDNTRHFMAITMLKPVIMDRKTYDSIGKLLPGRQTIVMTRQEDAEIPGSIVVNSLVGAIAAAKGVITQTHAQDIFVVGGSEIYREALPHAERLYLTLIDEKDDNADTFFPEYEELFPFMAMRSHRGQDLESGLYYEFVVRTKHKAQE